MSLFSRVKALEDERKAIIREYEGVIVLRYFRFMTLNHSWNTQW